MSNNLIMCGVMYLRIVFPGQSLASSSHLHPTAEAARRFGDRARCKSALQSLVMMAKHRKTLCRELLELHQVKLRDFEANRSLSFESASHTCATFVWLNVMFVFFGTPKKNAITFVLYILTLQCEFTSPHL